MSQSTVLFSLFLESPDFEVQFDGIIGNKSVKSANLWQSSTLCLECADWGQRRRARGSVVLTELERQTCAACTSKKIGTKNFAAAVQ